jgi:hypothetical protein
LKKSLVFAEDVNRADSLAIALDGRTHAVEQVTKPRLFLNCRHMLSETVGDFPRYAEPGDHIHNTLAHRFEL